MPSAPRACKSQKMLSATHEEYDAEMHLVMLVAIALAATFEPENLKGVTSMRVVVENIPGADKVGLDPDVVQMNSR
jgi:hypothetical protein